jgi:flagellar basal body-associated protein FliL
MNKRKLTIILLAIFTVFILIGGGCYYWKIKIQKISEPTKSITEQAMEDVQKIAASTSANIGSSVSPNVTVPTINPIKTDVNPYSETNPFSNFKVNPFQ